MQLAGLARQWLAGDGEAFTLARSNQVTQTHLISCQGGKFHAVLMYAAWPPASNGTDITGLAYFAQVIDKDRCWLLGTTQIKCSVFIAVKCGEQGLHQRSKTALAFALHKLIAGGRHPGKPKSRLPVAVAQKPLIKFLLDTDQRLASLWRIRRHNQEFTGRIGYLGC